MNGYCTNLSIGVYGRFANQAYEIAGVLGVARRNGLTPVFPLWENKDHRDRFNSTEDVEVFKHLVNPLPPLPAGVEFTHKSVDWGFHDTVLPGGNWNISGHFQSEKYFEHCMDELRWYMRMEGDYPQSDFCAIHLRHGDYSTEIGYHPRMTMNYFSKAMAEFPSDQPYLVFSDDIPAARQMFGAKVLYAEGDYLDDFKRMKACRHFIISNSSYSAMAAVLGEAKDKKVVAPRPWFGPAAAITGEDIYGKDWTVLNWQ